MFESAEEARRATQKDRETFSVEKFGERYVRVYPSLESDASDISQAVLQQNMTHPQVRRLRPWAVKKLCFARVSDCLCLARLVRAC